MEQTEEKGQWLVSLRNLGVVAVQEDERLVAVGRMAEVRYSVQVVEGLDKGVQAGLAWEGRGVHIPLVVAVQKIPLEPHAVMVVGTVAEGHRTATQPPQVALLEVVAVVATIHRITMAAQVPEAKLESLVGR